MTKRLYVPRLAGEESLPEIGGAELNFQLLESGRSERSGTFRISATSVDLVAGHALFALDSTGARHLLVPILKDAPSVHDSESAGIKVATRTLIESNMERRFLDVGCTLPSLHRLFSHVVDEILAAFDTDVSNPGRTCLVVLNRWRELFARGPGPKLSESEIVGLMGELLILTRIAAISPASAMKCWTGWDKEKVDFFTDGHALEVKSSSAREGRFATIHGLNQLESHDQLRLFLLFMRFQKVGARTQSLPNMIDSLLGLGVNAGELNRRLALQRYLPEDRDYYSDIRYELVEELFFEVSEGFPRLVPSELRDASILDRISSVQYRIDLAGVSPLAKAHLDASINLMGHS